MKASEEWFELLKEQENSNDEDTMFNLKAIGMLLRHITVLEDKVEALEKKL